ncbi:CPBP family intramembrane metalloprotease [Neobacillus notoginsengisoli]|uniref:CPBP family intramembrane metalloprotease n=1 Tax=Neobacillus notoginsengisoli TaxID=1578198 RepID=A0A417YFB2_9BACI|nr:type II CAAX endopeptidase family protein [Neobacillus notoginsengisoli]RHW31412.1 CPBP family intramembrane metalloprotease [Neobacillus notoginsengisoli]
MVSKNFDYRLLGGFLLAHFLFYFSFQDRHIFWYIFPASLLVLTIWAIMQEEVDDRVPFVKYMTAGIVSGFILFGLFYFGKYMINLFNLPLTGSIAKLYRWFSPKEFWQYIALVLIAVPGEELFWRGFVQKRILRHTAVLPSVLISSAMYASVHIYSSQPILVFAALVSGVVWGLLYAWKRSLPLVIVSHLIFDLMIFIISPLN